jgi:hypothetical protein
LATKTCNGRLVSPASFVGLGCGPRSGRGLARRGRHPLGLRVVSVHIVSLQAGTDVVGRFAKTDKAADEVPPFLAWAGWDANRVRGRRRNGCEYGRRRTFAEPDESGASLAAMRSGTVQVPQLVGLAVVEAHDLALDVGVRAVDVRAGVEDWAGTVTRQRPRSGRLVTAGACVHILVARGGPEDNDDDGPGGGGGGG